MSTTLCPAGICHDESGWLPCVHARTATLPADPHRAEAARRTHAAGGDGALALVEAVKESAALRARVAELEKWQREADELLERAVRGAAAHGVARVAAAEERGRALAVELRKRHRADCARFCLPTRHSAECLSLAPLLEKEVSRG